MLHSAIACFSSILAKFEDLRNNVPKIAQLNDPSFGMDFTPAEYKKVEERILRAFNFNIALPTAAHFLEFLLTDAITLQDMQSNSKMFLWCLDEANKKMKEYAIQFLEISLEGEMQFHNKLAIAILYTVVQILVINIGIYFANSYIVFRADDLELAYWDVFSRVELYENITKHYLNHYFA